jgi:hypothetical protein
MHHGPTRRAEGIAFDYGLATAITERSLNRMEPSPSILSNVAIRWINSTDSGSPQPTGG